MWSELLVMQDFQDSIASVIADATSQSGKDNNEGLCHFETHNPKRQTMRNVQLLNV